MEKFICPKCKQDLRKVGIFISEIGSTIHFVKYNENGSYESDEYYDGYTDEYVAQCGNCQAKLDLELGQVWNTLPEKIDLIEE